MNSFSVTLPLLFALGIRILINLLNPDHVPTTADHILQGLWQGVLLYHSLTHIPDVALVVGVAIAAKLVYDFSRSDPDAVSKPLSAVIGIALGVLVTNVLSQFLEDAGFTPRPVPSAPKPKERDRIASNGVPNVPRERERERERETPAHELSSRRLRLVSFGRANPDRHRPSRHNAPREHDPHPRHTSFDPRDAVSPAPTHALSIDTQPSISIESCPSSIDPHGLLSPHEREVAILRARASLADSERRRFKEERKWALSQGNRARAHQLAWQVKRYAGLMESYHREADAKVAEGTFSISSLFSTADANVSCSCAGSSIRGFRICRSLDQCKTQLVSTCGLATRRLFLFL